MRAALLQRQAALAGVALLAALAVVALSRAGDGDSQEPAGSPPATRAEWQSARVAVLDAGRVGRPTACGAPLGPETVGVAHPVLPCGVALVLSSGGREVRAEVVERGGVAEGITFELTPALADELGVSGPQELRWRFAD